MIFFFFLEYFVFLVSICSCRFTPATVKRVIMHVKSKLNMLNSHHEAPVKAKSDSIDAR